MASVSTRAVLLRAHDYGDSSRILRFHTRDHGLLSVVARGVRGRSGKGTTLATTFATGELVAYVKAHRDLHTMKDFACTHARQGLGSDVVRFAGASALADLLLAHAEQERHEELFDVLESQLDRLETAGADSLSGAVLAALWVVTEAFGFAPQLDVCVRCGQLPDEEGMGRFDLAAGGLRCAACAQDAAGPRIGPVARAQLTALQQGRIPPGLTRARQHLALVSDFLAYHVVSRPLKSLAFLGRVLPDETGGAE